VVLAVALVAAFTLPTELVFALAAEHGPVETLQALLLFTLAAACFPFRREEGVLTTGSMAFLLFAMGARELEWHKAWIGGNILKPRFYLGPAATPGTKLLAGVLVLLLAASAIYLVKRHLRETWNGLRRREPLAITAATFLVVLVLSRIADKSHFGHPLSPIVAGTLIVEEMLELALPLLVLLGAVKYNAARAEVPATQSLREVEARTATGG
jgi:hypothetical protein